MVKKNKRIIAIDGPSGAGKGTLGKALAQRLGFAYLDTGSLFRSLALKALEKGIDLEDQEQLSALSRDLSPKDWQREGLRAPTIAEAASQIATYPGVREALGDYARSFAKNPGKAYRGVVLDGRDIGTVVCPDAFLKLFITASAEERARRRFLELQSSGFTGTFEKVLNDIRDRDQRDQSRDLSPLKPAPDAIVIDTTTLNADKVLSIVLDYIMQSLSSNMG